MFIALNSYILDLLQKYKLPLCFPPSQGGTIGGFARGLMIIKLFKVQLWRGHVFCPFLPCSTAMLWNRQHYQTPTSKTPKHLQIQAQHSVLHLCV